MGPGLAAFEIGDGGQHGRKPRDRPAAFGPIEAGGMEPQAWHLVKRSDATPEQIGFYRSAADRYTHCKQASCRLLGFGGSWWP